jgi:hypothetical protein
MRLVSILDPYRNTVTSHYNEHVKYTCNYRNRYTLITQSIKRPVDSLYDYVKAWQLRDWLMRIKFAVEIQLEIFDVILLEISDIVLQMEILDYVMQDILIPYKFQ